MATVAEWKIQSDCMKWFKNEFVEQLDHLSIEQQKHLRTLYHGNQNELPKFQNVKMSTNARAVLNGWYRKLKLMGLTSGVSDTSLKCRVCHEGVTYGFVEIEYKTETGRQSTRQKGYQKATETGGGLYKVIRSEKEFKQFIYGLIFLI